MEEEIEDVKETVPEDEQEPEMTDSDKEELPEPEEVVEGMETKDLRRRLVKALRTQYGSKSRHLGKDDAKHEPGSEAVKEEKARRNSSIPPKNDGDTTNETRDKQ
jgi:hypothetical protein